MTSGPSASASVPTALIAFADSDLCVKCNICTSACPVAAVTEEFPGPKAVGPQAARFREPGQPRLEVALDWCSGCGVCSRVCPHHVPVAEMNIIAKAEAQVTARHALRDWGLARPDEIARWGRPLRRLVGALLESALARRAAEAAVGLARSAPLPRIAPVPLRTLAASRSSATPGPAGPGTAGVVAYFHGCSTNQYEPWLGQTTIRLLEGLGLRVELPPQGCCGLPRQSNRDFAGARRRAWANLASLSAWAEKGIPIVGTSTSCTLALKHEYRAVLGLSGAAAEAVAEATYDLFEFLDLFGYPGNARAMAPVPLRVLYHAPCQLKSHGVGSPALRVLRAIPELELLVSESECCGVAGTYGLKQERYPVACDVGRRLFEQARRSRVDLVLTDSETCRWWVERHSGIPSRHPVEVLAAALGVDVQPPLPTGSPR